MGQRGIWTELGIVVAVFLFGVMLGLSILKLTGTI